MTKVVFFYPLEIPLKINEYHLAALVQMRINIIDVSSAKGKMFILSLLHGHFLL